MQKFADHCCEKCTHTPETPCEQFIECCLKGPLCHEEETCQEKRQAIIDRLSHNPKYLEH